MVDDAYYRDMVAQLQREFTRAVEALEKQVAALTRHNTLLATELRQAKQQLREEAAHAAARVHEVQHELERQATHAAAARRDGADREQALSLEVAALKSLVQHETDYWTRSDQVNRDDRDRLTRQVAEAKAEMQQYHEENKTLRREMKALESRVETAVATSRSFEQRLVVVVQEKHEMDLQLARYRKKLHDKRVQKKYLTEALVRLQERQPHRQESVGTMAREATTVEKTTSDATVEGPGQRRHVVRTRELTLPEEIKAATNGTMYKRMGRMMSSRTGTSPTSSSPEISPRSARVAPYKRAPSVATTTPTASDGNSFDSSSSGSLRRRRSLHNVTGRRRGSRNSSDSDNIDLSPTTNAARREVANPTGRLERELSGLRRKLDSCMADAAARW